MTLRLYIECFVMFTAGQALHLFWIKVPSLKEKEGANNTSFLFKKFWACDWNVIIGTQLLGLMLFIGIDQLAHWSAYIMEYVKWFFSAVGAFAGSVGLAKFSKYEKDLINVLDKKANISDILTGGTSTVKETIEKGTAATGKDVSVAPK